ncbi:MAG: Gfo/Idh/MocA family oxidoreductase [Pirellulales bacterium]|nr:Gfo/Idh/MocA family oxidoreductase [Pirellulales bacterium]
MKSPLISRRGFLKNSSLLAAGAVSVPYWIPAGALAADGRPGANDRVGIGVVGIGRRAPQVLGDLPAEAQIVAIADVYAPRCQEACKKYQAQPTRHYRELLARKDVDAIVTATNDQWRALISIHACQAGKDVYAEKPLTLTILEGRRIVEAVRKYGRVLQTGGQQRSMTPNRVGCELIRGGGIGKIEKVVAFNYPSPWECALPAQPIPDGLDWNEWCGPAELQPFNTDIFTPRADPGWISYRIFSGGEMTGWGAHGLDMIQWALGMDDSGPIEVWTEGAKFAPPVNKEPMPVKTGDALCDAPQVFFKYPGNIVVELAERCVVNGKRVNTPRGGAIFYGEKGVATIDRATFKTDPPEIARQALKAANSGRENAQALHDRNWIDCIKTRKRPVNDAEIGHRTSTACHLGNIARWVGRKLVWDPVKEQFVGDAEANRFLDRPRRKGYELPEKV